MKLVKTLIVGGLLFAGVSAFGGTASEADKKWLEVVSNMVAQGQSSVSTPSETRATLLKDWSAKNGYSAVFEKTDAGYRISLSKSVAQK